LSSIDSFRTKTENDLQTGEFLKDEKEQQLMLVHAMASAGQVTSSKLDEIFQSRKDWEKKMEDLKAEKEEQEKKYSTVTQEKEKEIEELKKQLELIKNNIKNVDSHFESTCKDEAVEGNVTNNAVAQPMVSAVASGSNESEGYSSLYSIKPINWRSKYSNAEEIMGKLHNPVQYYN
jgi:septal ring factor EnvC (AmiA/AmiB activator)